MSVVLMLLKIVLVIWTILVAGNFFHCLRVGFISLMNGAEIESVLIKRAGKLLYLNMLVDWIVAAAIYIGESMLYGKPSEYPVNFFYISGMLLLIISIVSAAFIIVLSLNVNEQNYSTISVLINFIGISFTFAIILWLSVWLIM